MIKKTYSSPKLVVLGTVRELTQGNIDGEGLDSVFPARTPKSNLRFS